jgi:hypothetical protein
VVYKITQPYWKSFFQFTVGKLFCNAFFNFNSDEFLGTASFKSLKIQPYIQMDREKRETALVEQYLELKGSKLKSKDAFEKIQKMGFRKTRTTMYRHIVSVRSTGHAL